MKNVRSLLAAACLFAPALTLSAAPAFDLNGAWTGTLDAGAMKLHVVFNVTQAADGTLTATMDSPDQGARGIPVESAVLDGTTLRFEIHKVGGTYVGTLDATGTAVTGQWSQRSNSLPLNLVKGATASTAAPSEELSPADLEASKAAALKISGTWNGTLAAGGANLRLRVNLSTAPTGAATGTMDSLDQHANGIPLRTITLKVDKVRFTVPGVGGVYEATLAEDGTTLEGQWQQGGQSLPLNLQRAKPE